MKRITDRFLLMMKGINKSSLLKLTFIFSGIASTIWFLVRVIPKPSRATYPCMRVAAPMMSSFVIWLLTLSGSLAIFRKARLSFARSKYLVGGLLLLASVIGLTFLSFNQNSNAASGKNTEWIIVPNQPVGTPKGIFPGRVVWIHDPAVTTWDSVSGNWWDDKFVSQTESDLMMKESLLNLTGEKNEKKAWNAIFRDFNKRRNGKTSGYTSGQKIAIKINTNNTYSHRNSPEINATPQMVLSLLKSLVNAGGVPQNCITVFDASRFITDNIFDKCHAIFPQVIFVDNVGGEGRTKSAYVGNAIPYSVDNGRLANGLATCAVDADYLVNMALLKGHVGQGVTLCAKNYYGVTSIDNNWRKNAHNNFNPDRSGKAQYLTFVDFLAHKDLGGKTMICFIDGVYGSKLVNGAPGPKWKMEPFNKSWGCSLLASQDPVAIDAVGLDFLRSEWPDAPDMAFSDMYLIEAAQADNPPSKAKYDPQRNNARVTSLGVMEHWNNMKDKKYSRNLGKDQGIELLAKTVTAK